MRGVAAFLPDWPRQGWRHPSPAWRKRRHM